MERQRRVPRGAGHADGAVRFSSAAGRQGPSSRRVGRDARMMMCLTHGCGTMRGDCAVKVAGEPARVICIWISRMPVFSNRVAGEYQPLGTDGSSGMRPDRGVASYKHSEFEHRGTLAPCADRAVRP